MPFFGPTAGAHVSFWKELDPKLRTNVLHSKVWKHATFPRVGTDLKVAARRWIDELELRETLRECMQWRFAYGDFEKERKVVQYWF
mmetsp:Transcript_24961/g.69092  ORF Transcript_24961/g.69092 Transcript_24961/m.69092 type:complete len:86 (+) Transcript_24961:181-438(+)